MFDKTISGELPEHIDFIHKTISILESWGHEVKILRANKTYIDNFYHVIEKPRTEAGRGRKGLRCGFPMMGKCDINGRCKVKPIKDYISSLHGEYEQYIGIASDEPERIERMRKDARKKSLLIKYECNEARAYELCKNYDLLSPVYQFSNRGGAGSVQMPEIAS